MYGTITPLDRAKASARYVKTDPVFRKAMKLTPTHNPEK